ncbi:MAG: UDP-glucose 4-epimerase GalE [Phycisphaeraceae bacterium]
MRILLTGGAGYVGSACLRWLIKHGHEPVAFDNLSEGNPPAVPDDRLIVGDILDTDPLAQAMRDSGAEAVMHFAALALVSDSINEPDRYWQNNLMGTRSVLEAMRQAEVNRILFSSTCATYAFGAEMPITEETPQKPQTPYGTTKLAAENIIRDYARAFGFGCTLLRYFNASGADPDGQFGEDHTHETHLIPLILQAAVGRRDKVTLYGTDWPTPDGTCVRDFVHTDDLAQAHQLAIEALQPGEDRLYNIGTGVGTTVMQVLKACEKAAGRPIPHELADRRPGDPATLVASSARIRHELGWDPQYTDINKTVATAWKWHNANPDGYAKDPVQN